MVGFDVIGATTTTNGFKENIYGSGDCEPSKPPQIPTNIVSRGAHPQPWCGGHAAGEGGGQRAVYSYSQQADDKDKSPMCRVAELARFHKLRHEYKLLDESGPAHKKLFSVQLVLTETQCFEGSGASIKKAQQAAAERALRETTLPLPPSADQKAKRRKDPNTPSFLLQHVCRRLQLPPPKFHPRTLPLPPPSPLHPMPPMRSTPSPFINANRVVLPPSPGMPLSPLSHGGGGPPVSPSARYYMPNLPGSPQQLRGPSQLSVHSPHSHHHLHSPSSAPPPPPPPHVVMSPHGRPVCQLAVSVQIGPPLMYPEFIGVAASFALAKEAAAIEALQCLHPAIAELDAKERAQAAAAATPLLAAHQHSSPDAPGYDGEKGGVGVGGGVARSDSRSDDEADEERDKSVSYPSPSSGGKKSVVSQLHECALHMKVNVEFEVVTEEGLPHDRHYVVRCRLVSPDGTLIMEEQGDGKKKKTAKQKACAALLTRLSGIERSPIFLASALYKQAQKKQQANGGKETKRKTIVKDKKMDPEYGHQINPVSRLIQVLQARGESEPSFELVGEHGQSRYKEFVYEVRCSLAPPCCGSGPNKRLAKRAAAEEMLGQLGFSKPMPQPGKSLLKRRPGEEGAAEGEMSIGVFDPSECGVEESVVEEEQKEEKKQLTFADAEQEEETEKEQGEERSRQSSGESDAQKRSASSVSVTAPSPSSLPPQSPGAKRRVTFSQSVYACPPPDDENYPAAQEERLRSEDTVMVSKLRRRGRDGKRALTAEQRSELGDASRVFLAAYCGNRRVAILPNTADPSSPEGGLAHQMETARRRLEIFSNTYKFTALYTNFPKSPDGSDQQYFALVSLGIDKPIVCHGSGATVEAAADNAAYNAICSLAKMGLDEGPATKA